MRMINLRSRRGIAEVLSTLLAIPFFAILIGFMAYFGRALYAKTAIEDAAATGARWAATSLSGRKGCAQAREAMQIVLAGYALDPSGATLFVKPVSASWGRGTQAEVRVNYKLSQSNALFFGRLLGDSTLTTRYRVVVDRYNNRFANGWQACAP
jgi:Flp pilus assembly protein TadG